MSRFSSLRTILCMYVIQAVSVSSPLFGQTPQETTSEDEIPLDSANKSSALQEGANEKLPEPPSGLAGNWLGYRTKFAEKGLDFSYVYKGEVARNIKGGIESDTQYLQNMDMKLALDGEKLIGLNGGSALLHYLYNFSDLLSEKVGDAQVTSNIEGPNTISRWYELWLQQEFFEGAFSILAGLHDLNSEFYVTETSGLFLNSSFGVGKELSQTGVNGPSIFPTTSPALRVRISPEKRFYLQTAAFNAQSGELDKPKGSSFRLNQNDGLLVISELGYAPSSSSQMPAKYGFGYWTYTKTLDHLSVDLSQADKKVTNRGYYVLLDQTITAKMSAFARYGTAAHEVNQFASCLAVGGVFNGLMTDGTDQLGFGVVQANLGKTQLDNLRSEGLESTKSETTYELSYKFEVYTGVALQPDFQYVVNPSASSELNDAVVGSLRLEVTF